MTPQNSTPIAQRCLALTGSIETSTLPPACFSCMAGDFDGMGISYGALQWNMGQGTLQPLLSDMLTLSAGVMTEVFQDNLPLLQAMLGQTSDRQLVWSRSIQDSKRHTIADPWKRMLQALGRTPEFQAVQLAHAEPYHRNALVLCQRFGVASQRALALMFDICVQNGSINNVVETAIRSDFARLANDDEVGKLRSIANRRAEAASPRFVEDVRSRKLMIANGEGIVHGIHYKLEEQFGISLDPIAASNPA